MFSALFKRRSNAAPEHVTPAKVTFGPCIFCAAQIAETERDPLSLQVSENRGSSVIWFAHSRCLAERITPALSAFTEPERSEWLKPDLKSEHAV